MFMSGRLFDSVTPLRGAIEWVAGGLPDDGKESLWLCHKQIQKEKKADRRARGSTFEGRLSMVTMRKDGIRGLSSIVR